MAVQPEVIWECQGCSTAIAVGAEEEEVEGIRVDFYLVVFLKFIASIMLTIEVDWTMSF